MNLQHTYMRAALVNVQSVKEKSPEVQQAYLGLCRQIPGLILTNGLLLTAAYVHAKSGTGSDRPTAFRLIHSHMKDALRIEDLKQPLTEAIAAENIMLNTMTLLNAWVYYKRFADTYLADDGDQFNDLDSAGLANSTNGDHDPAESEG